MTKNMSTLDRKLRGYAAAPVLRLVALLLGRELLERFWENHDATRRRSKDQYRSAVFAHSSTQAANALAVKLEVEQATGVF
jgi:Peptide methionine sulfoxide reductase